MKRYVQSLTTSLFLLCLLLIPQAAHAQEPSSTEAVAITTVISVIREALIEAQTNNVRGFPRLSKVIVSLNTLTAKEGGVVFKFLVFSIGTKRGTEDTSTLTIEMMPPPTVNSGTTASIDPAKVKRSLAQAINTAKESILQVNESGEPKLVTSKVEIELKFAVKKSGSAGIDIELLPIGVEGTGDLKKSQVHSLKLVFGT